MKYKHGFIVMKGYPFHNGHLFLIRVAANQCEKVTVLLCSLPSETIPGHLRYNWAKTECLIFPNVTVKHFTEIVPQEPSESPDFWDIWLKIIRNNTDNSLDVVFSSEDYGQEIANRLNLYNVVVDKERQHWPISGTLLRNNHLAATYQMYLPESVKPYFTKKVAILGPESVGKTMLVKSLAKRFDVPYVPEYGRIYYEGKQDEPFDITYDDIINISKGQKLLHETILSQCDKMLLISDTDAITTKIYAKMFYQYIKHADPGHSTSYFNTIDKYNDTNFDLYIVLGPHVSAVQDGGRVLLPYRFIHFRSLINQLKAEGKNYVVINDKNYEQRIKKAYEHVYNLLNGLNLV
jgi:HTH-type transcriptional repressor of NAD biosynthesis genes